MLLVKLCKVFLSTYLQSEGPTNRIQGPKVWTDALQKKHHLLSFSLFFREFMQQLSSNTWLPIWFLYIPHHIVHPPQSFCYELDAQPLRLQHIHLKLLLLVLSVCVLKWYERSDPSGKCDSSKHAAIICVYASRDSSLFQHWLACELPHRI